MTVRSFPPALPEWPLAMLMRTLPDSVHVEILSRLFNHLLRGQNIAGRLPELNGKRICLAFTDTGSALYFRIEQGSFRRLATSARDERAWDVRISGTLHDFLLLATRREDPDTLFFNRRLAIEGDTETGLHVKNLLDALDYDIQAHLDAVLGERLGRMTRDALRRSGVERLLSGLRLS